MVATKEAQWEGWPDCLPVYVFPQYLSVCLCLLINMLILIVDYQMDNLCCRNSPSSSVRGVRGFPPTSVVNKSIMQDLRQCVYLYLYLCEELLQISKFCDLRFVIWGWYSGAAWELRSSYATEHPHRDESAGVFVCSSFRACFLYVSLSSALMWADRLPKSPPGEFMLGSSLYFRWLGRTPFF